MNLKHWISAPMNLKHWISAFMLLSPLLLKTIDAADHKKQSSSVIDAPDYKKQSSSVTVTVVGRVFCDTCFQRKFTTKSYFIPGAWVAVECKTEKKNGAALGGKDKTDSHGVFRIQLPFDFSSEKDIESCGVRLLRTSVVSCNVPFIKKRSRLVIKSKMNNNYIYNAAPLTFRPARLPVLCKKQPPHDSKLSFPPISFPFPFPFPPIPPIGFPFPPFFPPIGDLPPIPFWPPLPDIPVPPPPPPPNLIEGSPPPLPFSPPPPPNLIEGSPPPLPFSPPPSTPNPMGSSPPLFPPPPPLPIVRYVPPPPIPLPSSPLRA